MNAPPCMSRVLPAAIVSLTAGCIITTGDDTSDVSSIMVSWKLTTAATNSTASCPSGFDTAAVYSQAVDSTGAATADPPIIDLFDCSAGIGQTSALPPAYYKEWVEITSTDNTMKFARSKSNLDDNQQLDVTNSNLTYATEIVVDGGYFHLTWNLVGDTSNQPLTCVEAGVTYGIALTALTTSSPATLFACDAMEGLTTPLSSGPYSISVQAFSTQAQVVGTAPTLADKTIADPSALQPVTDLGNVTIPITGM